MRQINQHIQFEVLKTVQAVLLAVFIINYVLGFTFIFSFNSHNNLDLETSIISILQMRLT